MPPEHRFSARNNEVCLTISYLFLIDEDHYLLHDLLHDQMPYIPKIYSIRVEMLLVIHRSCLHAKKVKPRNRPNGFGAFVAFLGHVFAARALFEE